jgi:putative transposase
MAKKSNAATEANAHESASGRPPKLSGEALNAFRGLVLAHPNATIEDLCLLVHKQLGVQLCELSMYRYLKRVGIRRKRPQPDGKTGKQGAPSTFVPVPPPTQYGYTQSHRDEGDEHHYPGALTNAEWQLVADLFDKKGPGKPPQYPRRKMLDACCYAVRTGCPWRMLPKDLPPWQDVYAHFRRWTAKNLFETMHDRLRAMWRQRAGRDAAPTAAVIDSQSVKTSAQGGPKGFDAGKKVKGRKRHLVVDVLGLTLAVLVHPGNLQDRDGAAPVVQRAVEKYPTLKKLYVDAAYGGSCAQALRTQYKLDVEVVRRPGAAGAWSDAQLALFAPEAKPFPILPRRWVVERTHSWVERPRRLSKDYDRRLDVSTAWIWLAETRILLRRLSQTESV